MENPKRHEEQHRFKDVWRETLEIQRLVVGRSVHKAAVVYQHTQVASSFEDMAPVPVKRKAEIKNAGKPPVKRGRPKGSKNKSKPSAVELEVVGDRR